MHHRYNLTQQTWTQQHQNWLEKIDSPPRHGMEEAAAHSRRGFEAAIFTAISTQMQQLMSTLPSSVLVPKPELLVIPYLLLLTLDPAVIHGATEEAREGYLIRHSPPRGLCRVGGVDSHLHISSGPFQAPMQDLQIRSFQF